MYYNTAYSIELNAVSHIPEWKKSVRIMLNEDGFFDEHGWFTFCVDNRLHILIKNYSEVFADTACFLSTIHRRRNKLISVDL
jgi:hypothetical protein